MFSAFTPAHRGGAGPPLVCLHGFADTWRTWALVLPALERRHDVLALTLAGHAGGPPIEGPVGEDVLADAVERAMDAAGMAARTSRATRSAATSRSSSRRAAARAPSWRSPPPAAGRAATQSFRDVLRLQTEMHAGLNAAAPHAETLLATRAGRRRATRSLTTNFEHIPRELLAHLMLGAARCDAAPALLEHAGRAGWPLDAAAIRCPVRIVWGTADRLLPWPSAAARFRDEWLPHADWVELDGVGHCPQLDVPLETAELILGFAAR